MEMSLRYISIHPLVYSTQYDYGLSRARPFDLHLRSGPRHPMTFYNVHPGLEVGILLSGREDRIFPDITLPVRAGDVWLVPMWEMHGVTLSPAEARAIVLVFLPEFLGEVTLGETPWLGLFTVPASQRPRVTSETTRARVLEIGREIWKEGEQQPLGWQEAVHFHLLQLLLTLRREWQAPDQTATASLGRGGTLPRLMPVLAAVHADPFSRISLAEAAAKCELSARHFNRLFRQAMGISFGRFHLQTRIIAASRLLLSTNLVIESVAEQAGFVDASHFHHAFANQYGCTPIEYRRRFWEAAGEPGTESR